MRNNTSHIDSDIGVMINRDRYDPRSLMLVRPYAKLNELRGHPRPLYDVERYPSVNQYDQVRSQEQPLSETIGYDSMPLSKWTREQLEEQLTILKQREAAAMQQPKGWMPMQKSAKEPALGVPPNEVYKFGVKPMDPPIIAPHGMPPLKRRALSNVELQNQYNAYAKSVLQHPSFHDGVYNGSDNAHPANVVSNVSHEGVLSETVAMPALCRMETKLITTDDASQRSTVMSDVESEFGCETGSQAVQRNDTIGRTDSTPSNCDGVYDWKPENSDYFLTKDRLEFANSLDGTLRQHFINFTKTGVLSNELRQEYIRRSKLYPKVRGVWFNSTVRRMGWVGQAYKKCKRIEKIFSISKHGFDGARELAIAFRNSQKPSVSVPQVANKNLVPVDTSYSSGYNDFPVVETTDGTSGELEEQFSIPQDDVETDAEGYDEPTSRVESGPLSRAGVDDTEEEECYGSKSNDRQDYLTVKDLFDRGFELYKSNLTREEMVHRNHLCKGALRFMLHELSTLLDLDIPMPRMDREACRYGLQYHLDVLDRSQTTADMMPYIAIFGGYICVGITPLDIPFNEVYTILRTLSYAKPLGGTFKSRHTKPFVDDSEEVALGDLIIV
ncbi:uncharacterized protein BXIN_2860 [Babesia sp. Xinjiang]|uniref:uncharacterized protein n=1 Tax=Babesia sp. Xinjiang TaxID=462227 RepID=UPI000A21E19D|nr:uncharacterized protein BXIN_2860 [Babesia sp. Xinjiang]ORM39567.1 hypothetical protein BXIN_2860 [Babesia sp. Xinjiang]